MTGAFAEVSVIVAAYRAANTIERAMMSIARQTVKPREVVVVDDGSDDGTREAAEACAGRMKGVDLRVFRTDDNRGAGAARNRAIEESRHPVLAFLDADDEWLPEKLERSLAHLETNDCVLVAHDYVTGDGADAPRAHCADRFHESADPFIGLYRKGFIPSCSVVARKHAVIAAGGFDPGLRNAQDFDLWLAMLRRPRTPFLVFGEPLLRYHLTPGGIMSHTRRRLRCCMDIAVRYFPDLKTRPGSALISLWFRVVVLHGEAVRAYAQRGNIVGLLSMAGRLPLSLLVATIQCLSRPPASRGRFLSINEALDDG